jgi:hypothetical protein
MSRLRTIVPDVKEIKEASWFIYGAIRRAKETETGYMLLHYYGGDEGSLFLSQSLKRV